MIDLSAKKCIACTAVTDKLPKEEAWTYLEHLNDWHFGKGETSIFKKIEFKNFKQTMFFINAVAFLCEKEGHHPQVRFGYNYCEIHFTTHAIAGLSENDFICAAKVDQLLI